MIYIPWEHGKCQVEQVTNWVIFYTYAVHTLAGKKKRMGMGMRMRMGRWEEEEEEEEEGKGGTGTGAGAGTGGKRVVGAENNK